MKIRLIPIILSVLLLLSSCSTPGQNTDNNNNVIYDTPDTSGMHMLCVTTESGVVPVTYTVDGNLSLTDENYYYDIKNIVENEESVKQKTFTYFDAGGKNLGGVSYNELSKNKIKSEPYQAVITSGNWKLCPDMRYQTYNGKKDSASDGYKEFITETFADKFTQAQPQITDIWEYDLDLDGTNEAVVRAKDDVYTVLVLLSQSLGNTVLASDFNNDSKFAAQPYFVDIDANGNFSLMVLSGSNVKTVTMYGECSVKPQYTVYLPLES